MATTRKADRFLLILIIVLSCVGYFIFTSASLGLVGREGASFTTVATKQSLILVVGFVLMTLAANIPFKNWRKYALSFLVGSVVLCILVFVPKIGTALNGAHRWVGFGPVSFQPAEILKLALVIYLAAWLGASRDRLQNFKSGFLPFLIVLGICSVLLLLQPDTGTFMVIFGTAITMFIVGGGRWRYLILMIVGGVALVLVLAIAKPYIRGRLMTYIHPGNDALGSSYQLNQSLIAIGSGGLTGRGFGQSIQKFNFLPEPIGDSIFAVASEEFGFFGSSLIIILFLVFGLWGLKVASRVPDHFGRLLGVGIVILIISQSFINIGAMLGVIPLTGVPLNFISHGGTALLMTLLEAGILLNISRAEQH